MKKRHLITSALPYANGPLHFGHLAGVYLPADVYTRHLKLKGEKAIHISGSDEHGVAIMLNANKEKKAYQEYVDHWHLEHKNLFTQLNIEFDFFGQTSRDYHHEEVRLWFKALHEKDLIGTKETDQLQCQDCHSHLPDRFVKGECYECGYKDARGDECPNCGILIDPIRLVNPVCQICGSSNIKTVQVTQYYLLLSKLEGQFNEWLESKQKVWRKTVYPFVKALCKDGLIDRAISRDLDWGIDVPLGDAQGKKLYVWFDAPIGYVSNTKKMLKDNQSSEDYLEDWWLNPETEITHFIGKDNIIFHCIIFPCMSMASERTNLVYDVPANQYLNLEGKQFSKSSGWYVDANQAIDQFGSDALRYYLLSVLPETSDSSFTWESFQGRINGELANNIGNLVSRCLKFWQKKWPEGLASEAFCDFYGSSREEIIFKTLDEQHKLIEAKQLRRALESFMHLGHQVNLDFTERAPWKVYKDNPVEASKIIGECGIQILMLGVMLKPFLPSLSDKMIKGFGIESNDSLIEKLYCGERDVLKKIFANGLNLAEIPSILIPKIEDSIVEELNQQLKKRV